MVSITFSIPALSLGFSLSLSPSISLSLSLSVSLSLSRSFLLSYILALKYIYFFKFCFLHGTGKENNFKIHRNALTLNTSYDFGSVMHYTVESFAKDRSQPVMTIKGDYPYGTVIGQRAQYSKNDVLKIQRLYKCHVCY